jgi:hypothetical protein
MMKRILFAFTALAALGAAPLAAQQAPTRFAVEPYVGYGFFGGLPETSSRLDPAIAYGGRAAFQLAPQWALFGNFQRSTPEQVSTPIGGVEVNQGTVNVDHWAAGIEFSYVPRGGAEGMLPLVLEAGLGQARYDRFGSGGQNDLAVKLGLSSALQLSRNLSIRYGADDYISNFRDDGIVNQIFVRVGAELSF